MSEFELDPIKPERHPKRYTSHKYWGRKPYNVIRKYVENFTEEGDKVLDPFSGSGVTPIEANALNRIGYGYDTNPIAVFMSRSLAIDDVDISQLKSVLNEKLMKVQEEYDELYGITCECGESGQIISVVWEDDSPYKIFYECSECGRQDSEPGEVEYITEFGSLSNADEKFPVCELPKDSDAETTKGLFTKRNRIALVKLYDEIQEIEDEELRRLGTYTFLSNLPMVSKLIPVHKKRLERGVLPSGVWGFKRHWIPSMRMENNVFYYFNKRIDRTLEAKKETNKILNSKGESHFYKKSSEDMNALNNGEIDYIFADPPFGKNVDYDGLSAIWNCWLKEDSNKDAGMDDDSDLELFKDKMSAIFNECERVLAEEGHITVAFQNKDFSIWKALMVSIIESGFKMEYNVLQPVATRSFTQETRHGNVDGHFLYTFSKGEAKVETDLDVEEIEREILEKAENIIQPSGATISQLHGEILPLVVNQGYLDSIGDIGENLEDILDKRFEKKEKAEIVEGNEGPKEIKKTLWVPEDYSEDETIRHYIRSRINECKDIEEAKKELADDVLEEFGSEEVNLNTFSKKRDIQNIIEDEWESGPQG